MSNRLQNNVRLPFSSDISMARDVAQLVSDTRARAELVRDFGDTINILLGAFPRAVRNLFSMVHDAEDLRDTNTAAFYGVQFDTKQVPNPYVRSRIVGMG